MAIICATDFSDIARQAEEAAAALAGRLGQPLWLLHVQEEHPELTSPEGWERAQGVVEERMTSTAARLQGLCGQLPKVAVKLGRAAAVVPEFAKAHEGQLIVVGSVGHGSSPLAKLGGTSERLASGTDVPVLVIREGESFKDWALGRPFRALVGLEQGEASASALRWIAKLRAVAPCDVILGRVYYSSDAHQRYGVADMRMSYTEADPKIEALIERDLKRMVPSLPGQGELFYRAKLGIGRVADHLLELAEAERCQLVVVGSHGRRGLARMWSASAAALHLARMSVAVIPVDGQGAGSLAPAPQLKRVLVATDFSALGNAAIPWAYATVQRGGEVTLAHVMPAEATARQLAELYSPELPLPLASPRVEAEVAARLRALTPESASERGVMTRTEVVRSSDPAKALLALSEQLGVDAVVLSSHGRSGLMRAARGSIAEAILRGSSRPVLVVRPPGE